MRLDAFLSNILVELPGCSDPLAQQALLRTASEFCTRTLVWSEILDPITLDEGERDYELDVPSGAYVCMVQGVWRNNQQLSPTTMMDLQRRLPDWRTARGSPAFYNCAPDRAVLSVFPAPAAQGGEPMVVRAAFSLLHDAREVPELFAGAFFGALCAGAKARLMAMPGQNWSNPALTPYYQAQFDSGIADALAEVAHDGVPGSLTVQPRRFL